MTKKIFLIVMVLFCFKTIFALPAVFKDVVLTHQDNKSILFIEIIGDYDYKVTEGFRWVNIDLSNVITKWDKTTLDLSNTLLQEVRTVKLFEGKINILRLELHYTIDPTYKIDRVKNGIRVIFSPPKAKKPLPKYDTQYAEIFFDTHLIEDEAIKKAQDEFNDYIDRLIEAKRLSLGELDEESRQLEKIKPAGNNKTSESAAMPEKEMSQNVKPVPAKKRLISMSFKEADLKTVLRVIARENDMNMLITDDIEGKFTAEFKDVPIMEVLNTILEANGYILKKGENLYRIAKIDDKKNTFDRESRIFKLKYVTGENILSVIKPILSSTGKIKIVNDTNITNGSLTRILMVKDNKVVLNEIDNVIKQIDKRPDQILLSAKIITQNIIDGQEKEKEQIDWDIHKVDELVLKKEDFEYKYGILSFKQSRKLLKELSDKKDISFVSEPSLIMQDGMQSEFEVTDIYPQTDKYNKELKSTQNIGLKVKVTPFINKETGEIEMEIIPVVQNIESVDPVTQRPIVSNRTVKTRCILHSNEVMVLKGWKYKGYKYEKKRVPIFGWIPFIEDTFTYFSKTPVMTDITLFISPKIL